MRDCNKGDGDEGGGRAAAMRATVTVMAIAMATVSDGQYSGICAAARNSHNRGGNQ
jgi:hypothetical protein